MVFADPIKGDLDIASAEVLELQRRGRIDPGAVGCDGKVQPSRARIADEIIKVRVKHRFAASQQNCGHLEIGKVIDDVDAFL